MDEHSAIVVPSVPDGYVRVGAFNRFVELVRTVGGKPEEILAALNLEERFLQQQDHVLPIAVRGALVAAVVKQTGCEHFGLLLGKQTRAADLGLPGRLLLASPTVGSALEQLIRYFHLHCQSLIPTLGGAGSEATLGYLVIEGSIPGFQELQDEALALGLSLMRRLVTPDWVPLAVRLTRRTPRHPEVYDRFFAAPCRFNAEHSELVFPAATLDWPVPEREALTWAAEIALPSAGSDVNGVAEMDCLHLVRRTALRLLMHDSCTQKAVAQALGISARTLNRNIERAGSSYREVIDYCRYTASRTLIKETDMPLVKVAQVLGYADHSSFCRAFKRWSGMPPTAWRLLKKDNGGNPSRYDV